MFVSPYTGYNIRGHKHVELSISFCVYSHIPIDPTLTPANIVKANQCRALWSCRESKREQLFYFDMPLNQQDEVGDGETDEKTKVEFFTKWLASHPCPTWEQVVLLLSCWVASMLSVELEKTYLRSELCLLVTTPPVICCM